MVTACGVGKSGTKGASIGFTLMELLVAIAVVSVASTIFISSYSSSVNLGRTARNRDIAADVARATLDAIAENPADYIWERPKEQGLFRVRANRDTIEAGEPVLPPAIEPADPRSRNRMQSLYRGFTWKAYARIPGAGGNEAAPNHYELVVVVLWQEQGRPRMLALNTAVPRSAVDNQETYWEDVVEEMRRKTAGAPEEGAAS